MNTPEALDDSAEPADLDSIAPAEIESPAEPDTPLDKLQARARKLPAERARTIVESLLFVSDKPLTEDAIEKASGIPPEQARAALERPGGHYREGTSGMVLHQVAGGWQLRTASDSSEYVRRMLQIKPQRLTRAALETMAIIAYRQPVTRPEIEDIRSVDSGAVVKALLEKKLIKILGKKEEAGRPMLYGTTREFLEFFNLKDLASLPTLREFQELSAESRQIVEEQTPVEEPAMSGMVQQLADPGFVARQHASSQASEAALAELESAMQEAEQKARTTEATLRPAPPAAGESEERE